MIFDCRFEKKCTQTCVASWRGVAATNKEFYVLAAVRAAADSRGALIPSNIPRTFSVRLNRFTGTINAVHIGTLGTVLERGEML